VNPLYEAAKLAGFEAEVGGGGDAVLFLSTADGNTICFGYANGPLGYTVFKGQEVGDPLEGPDCGGDMEQQDATPEQMAAFIRGIAEKWKAHQ